MVSDLIASLPFVLRATRGSWCGYKQADWYAIDVETAKPLFYQGSAGLAPVPGVRDATAAIKAINEGRNAEVVIHRTHLPLLTSSEALKFLTPIESADWSARATWAAERGFEFRVTQHQAIDFIAPRRGTLLGDDMRLGKTLTCAASHDPTRGPLVVVAPLSTRGVWLGWLRRCFPDLPIGVLTGKNKMEPERMSRPIVFCHYDILKYWQTAMRIGTLVLDEAHLICNRKTDRAKAVAVVASRAEKIIAATGTPIWDMPPDLWNVIGLLAPAAWGSYWDFGMRYGMPGHTGYGVVFTGSSNTEELSARLGEVKIRRLWHDVQKDLPPISRNIVVADLQEQVIRKLDILAAKLKKERTNTAANLAIYRSQICQVKLGTVLREAWKLLAGGQPIVIWTWHKEFAEQIHEKLNACSYLIHGDIAPDERERRMEMWRQNKMHPQANEQPLALVATMAVAQVGIDLSHSHLPIFAELDYVPAVIGQTEMRTFSPDRAMNVTFIVANHIVDQRLVRALVSKLNAADPLGFGAAVDAIDALREAFEGPRDDPDMERFLDDVISAGFEVA